VISTAISTVCVTPSGPDAAKAATTVMVSSTRAMLNIEAVVHHVLAAPLPDSSGRSITGRRLGHAPTVHILQRMPLPVLAPWNPPLRWSCPLHATEFHRTPAGAVSVPLPDTPKFASDPFAAGSPTAETKPSREPLQCPARDVLILMVP
jgi:hypothetical protein